LLIRDCSLWYLENGEGGHDTFLGRRRHRLMRSVLVIHLKAVSSFLVVSMWAVRKAKHQRKGILV